jgi:predicted SnoaL-like aldol condensation-catalyzing enzyme
MTTELEERNKTFVLEAFDTLFNKRDYGKATRFWSPNYIQHSAHIPPGREGLFNLIRGLPPTLRYESAKIAASGDFVIVHGRFSGTGRPRAWITADVCRIADGVLAEHWGVLQDEVTKAESVSGLPMFGTSFAESGHQPGPAAAASPLSNFLRGMLVINSTSLRSHEGESHWLYNESAKDS